MVSHCSPTAVNGLATAHRAERLNTAAIRTDLLRLIFHDFIAYTSFLVKRKYQIFAVVGATTFVIRQIIAIGIEHRRCVLMATEGKLQIGIHLHLIMEEASHIVVKLVGVGRGVHHGNGARSAGGQLLAVGLDEREIGDRHRIIVLQCIGVETNEMRVARIERKIRIAKHGAEHFRPGGQTVVVADETDIGHTEFLQLIAHPLKFLGGAEVGQVAAMNNEVDAVAPIDVLHGGMRLVVPTLRVADYGETNFLPSRRATFNALNVLRIDMFRPIDFGIVGMIVDEVATRQGEQAETRYEDNLNEVHTCKGKQKNLISIVL